MRGRGVIQVIRAVFEAGVLDFDRVCATLNERGIEFQPSTVKTQLYRWRKEKGVEVVIPLKTKPRFNRAGTPKGAPAGEPVAALPVAVQVTIDDGAQEQTVIGHLVGNGNRWDVLAQRTVEFPATVSNVVLDLQGKITESVCREPGFVLRSTLAPDATFEITEATAVKAGYFFEPVV